MEIFHYNEQPVLCGLMTSNTVRGGLHHLIPQFFYAESTLNDTWILQSSDLGSDLIKSEKGCSILEEGDRIQSGKDEWRFGRILPVQQDEREHVPMHERRFKTFP